MQGDLRVRVCIPLCGNKTHNDDEEESAKTNPYKDSIKVIKDVQDDLKNHVVKNFKANSFFRSRMIRWSCTCYNKLLTSLGIISLK